MIVMRCGVWIRAALSLVALLGSGCVSRSEREARPPAPRANVVIPDKVMEGEPFQRQPDGKSAISVTGENLAPGSRVRMNGKPLVSSASGPTVSAVVPPEFYEHEGIYPVSVETPDGQISNSLPFIVFAKTGPAPAIRKLYPEVATAGIPFNRQPNGASALGIVGEKFLPGAQILINGETQATNFGDIDRLGSLVPDKFLGKPGTLAIVVRNKDGKTSTPASLVISPAK